MKFYAEVNGQVLELDVEEQGEDLKVSFDGKTMVANLQKVSSPSLYSLILDNESHEIFVERREDDPCVTEYDVMIAGELHEVKLQDERAKRLEAVTPRSRAHEGEVVVKAPMPGLVVSIEVQPGEVVAKGHGLIALEAMKMRNELRAPRDATVKSINVQEGERVESGRVLVTLT